MAHATVGFTLDTLLRKKIEKLRRKEKDVRIHNRLSVLLWLDQGRSLEQVAELLGVCPRTVRNWLELYQRGGLEVLRTLAYQGRAGALRFAGFFRFSCSKRCQWHVFQ